MRYLILQRLLEQEGPDFYRINNQWKPKDLLPAPYRRTLLQDAQARLKSLDQAEDELQMLDRAVLYINALKRMRMSVRQAQFSWGVDDLKFMQSLGDFLSDYGTVLQHLKIDQARGQFKDQPEVGV